MVDNTALLCTLGERLPKHCLRDGHGALLSAHGTLHFLLICSTRQSLLNLLPPTRKPDYIYRRRKESSAAPTTLPIWHGDCCDPCCRRKACGYSRQEALHSKLGAALYAIHISTQNSQPADPRHAQSPNKAVRPEAWAGKAREWLGNCPGTELNNLRGHPVLQPLSGVTSEFSLFTR